MKHIWEQTWFIKFITWCRKWKWFDENIYGKSFNLEDFVRNPAEVLRDKYFPFVVKDIKPISVFNLRCGYRSALNNPEVPNCYLVPMGNKRRLIWEGKEWVYADLRIWNKWCTKFCNSMFFLQFAVSLWHYIPIPYISMCIKIMPWYFQFGLGWGPELRKATPVEYYDTVLCAKFRFVNEVKSNEAILNPSDVSGYYEGTI